MCAEKLVLATDSITQKWEPINWDPLILAHQHLNWHIILSKLIRKHVFLLIPPTDINIFEWPQTNDLGTFVIWWKTNSHYFIISLFQAFPNDMITHSRRAITVKKKISSNAVTRNCLYTPLWLYVMTSRLRDF